MKGLTVIQPWAWLIANGKKLIETRTWSTDYRGPLLIHAGKRFGSEESYVCHCFRGTYMRSSPVPESQRVPVPYDLELGAVVAVAELAGCRLLREDGLRSAAGFLGVEGEVPEYVARFFRHYHGFPRLYAWVLNDVRKLENPVVCRGLQKLWTPSEDVLARVNEQLQKNS